MRRPSARLTPNTVQVRRVTRWTADAHGGRVAEWGPPSAPMPAAVRPASAEDVPANLREAEVIYHNVLFYDDPGLRVRDLVLLGERVLAVTGVRSTAAGQGRTHVIDCEERPTHAAR